MDYYAVCIADATWSERNTSRAIDGPTFTFDFDYAQGITTADVWDQISLTLLGLYYEAEEN